MAQKKTKKDQILEGFTYEELPNSEQEVEIPQEMINNSIVIDLAEDLSVEIPAEPEDELEDTIVKDEDKAESKESSSVVEFELPNIKEPEILTKKEEEPKDVYYTPKKNNRNKSRKIMFPRRIINLEEVEVPDTVIPNFEKLSEVIRDYVTQIVVLEVLKTLKELDEVSEESLVNYFKESIPQYMQSITPTILKTFPQLEQIEGQNQIMQKKKFNGQEVIAIIVGQKLSYHNHLKTYSTVDIIEIPV